MSDYQEKLRSLNFRTAPAGPKITVEGDQREGVKTTLSDERQDVQVFMPPVDIVIDQPGFGQLREEAADFAADTKRKELEE